MKKNLLLLFLFLLPIGVFSQEEEVKRHTVELFMELDSGTLVNDTWGIFNGNFVETGLSYRYTVNPYFSIYTKAALSGGVNWNNQNIADDVTDLRNPIFKLNGIQSFKGGLAYLEFGMSFGEYGYIAMRQNLLIKAYAFAPIKIGEMHTVTFLGGVEAIPEIVGQKIIPGSDDLPGIPTEHSLKVLAIGINYKVTFIPRWKFATELQYRTSGEGERGGAAGPTGAWDADTLKALKINSSFRWDNTVYFAPAEGATIWAQVRYLPGYFVENTSTRRVGVPTHDVFLRFGYTQSFNF